MAFRSYVLAGLQPGTDRDGIAQTVAALEGMDEVTYAEPVVGPYDLLVAVESDSPIEEIVARMKKVKALCTLVPLKVNPVPSRERMHRNIQGIPHRPAK
jgi:hypothetical protein